MPEPITKPNFPPAPLPDTHYPFLATIGISRARLRKTCIREVEVVGISSIELNTVKVLFNGVIHEDVPVWIHTDYGTRRREIRGEEAVNPADYFERAALIFPLPGGKALAAVETVSESSVSVLGVISVRSNLESYFFKFSPGGETKPIEPRTGCWPTWKLYLDIEVYCNDWEHVSKNEYPALNRGYHRVVHDVHDDVTAQVLNIDFTGFVEAEFSIEDMDNPTAEEIEKKDIVDAFLERGTVIGRTLMSNGDINVSDQLETEYFKDTGEIFKPDPCLNPGWDTVPVSGKHYDMDSVQHDYSWEVASPVSWVVDARISAPFSPGTASHIKSGVHDEIITYACEMAGYAGRTQYVAPSDFIPVGLGVDMGKCWFIMMVDGTFAYPNQWMTVPFERRSPVPEGHSDLHQAAYQPNLFCERRRYEVDGVEIVFDSFNSDVVANKVVTTHLDGDDLPNGFYTESFTFSAKFNFTVTVNDGSPDPVIHSFSYDFNEYSYVDTEVPDRGEEEKTLANLTPLYIHSCQENYLHNTLFFSQGLGIATLKDDLGIDEVSRSVTITSKDTDAVYGVMDTSSDDSSLPVPSIDLSLILDAFKTRLASNTNEGWWIFPDGQEFERVLSYQAGHVHITCKSWLVPYDLREALI